MDNETPTPGLGLGLILFTIWFGTVTALYLDTPSDPWTRKVFAGHMAAIAAYGLFLTAFRLLHNVRMQTKAEAVARRECGAGFSDPELEQGWKRSYPAIVHNKRTWFRPLFASVAILALLWWQDLFPLPLPLM